MAPESRDMTVFVFQYWVDFLPATISGPASDCYVSFNGRRPLINGGAVARLLFLPHFPVSHTTRHARISLMIWTSLAFNQQLHVRITRVSRLCQVCTRSFPASSGAKPESCAWQRARLARICWSLGHTADRGSEITPPCYTDNEHPGRATAVDSTFEN
ncbi:hypothetical protein AUP68_05817 [Ilyonectria robusta]